MRRIAQVAALFADAGLVTLVAAISPMRRGREVARTLVAPGHFLEVHMAAPVDVCAARDPKGLYRRVREGSLALTGVHPDAPYEAPNAPELRIEAGTGLKDATRAILRAVAGSGLI